MAHALKSLFYEDYTASPLRINPLCLSLFSLSSERSKEAKKITITPDLRLSFTKHVFQQSTVVQNDYSIC